MCGSPNLLKEEIKKLKLMEIQLRDAISQLAQHRDCLVMELQQLQEAKPVLEKAYAVSLIFFFQCSIFYFKLIYFVLAFKPSQFNATNCTVRK